MKNIKNTKILLIIILFTQNLIITSGLNVEIKYSFDNSPSNRFGIELEIEGIVRSKGKCLGSDSRIEGIHISTDDYVDGLVSMELKTDPDTRSNIENDLKMINIILQNELFNDNVEKECKFNIQKDLKFKPQITIDYNMGKSSILTDLAWSKTIRDNFMKQWKKMILSGHSIEKRNMGFVVYNYLNTMCLYYSATKTYNHENGYTELWRLLDKFKSYVHKSKDEVIQLASVCHGIGICKNLMFNGLRENLFKYLSTLDEFIILDENNLASFKEDLINQLIMMRKDPRTVKVLNYNHYKSCINTIMGLKTSKEIVSLKQTSREFVVKNYKIFEIREVSKFIQIN